MEKAGRQRRYLLRLALIGVAAGALWRFLVPRLPKRKVLLEVVRDDIPHEGALVFREARAAVIRDGDEIYALSLVCTHLGCTVNVTPKEMICPCHGSVFDRHGAVLKGPAPRPLDRLPIEQQGEKVVVLG